MEPHARRATRLVVAAVIASIALDVRAQTPGTESPAPNDDASVVEATENTDSQAAAPDTTRLPDGVTLGGYVEALYAWNFNRPSNRITNARGFDNRHDSFTLSNVALDAALDRRGAIARLTLQVGHTPSTYYGAEPVSLGTPTVNASDASTWKYLQQAYAGYRIARSHETTLLAGLFLSPIGPETVAVRENWNWSRSTLFFALPYYHTGARARVALNDRWALSLHVYDGWNAVVDANGRKTLMAQATFDGGNGASASLLYATGVERLPGAIEGRRFRHLVDAYATIPVAERFELMAHVDGGFEPTRLGTAAWVGAALYARAELVSESLFLAARVDLLREWVPSDGVAVASPLFFPVAWVSSSTLTLDYRPHPSVSFRLEGRHDQAASDLYFGGTVVGDGSATMPYVPNRRGQTTALLGVVAGF